ncbi:MAG: hypothetical protein JWN17_2332 [Frankiales bacterium]|nr:hypothetical protein [Frankiales bacterium]
MRLTDFWARMERRFGAAYAASYARDMVLSELGGRTIHEALEDGDDAMAVWRAVCAATEVEASDR